MKVAKFGGSSLASATQMKKVFNIVQSDPERRIVVVSAPGKRFKDDTKVTDLLIELGENVLAGKPHEFVLQLILRRYGDMVRDLGITEPVMADVEQTLNDLVAGDTTQPAYFLDALKASGEDNNAKILAAYFRHEGLPAVYVNPKTIGLFVSDSPGNAHVLPEAYTNLYRLRDYQEIVVFPGFFGYTTDGKVITFSRGGSDITGAIVAKGVQAVMYENFTDVDGICVANPNLVDHPMRLNYLTYREMRELSYAGFSVFHDEALQPAFSEDIPVLVKNTNNPDGQGTLITKSTPTTLRLISGIASMTGFVSVYVSKYLMNKEIGFGRRLLQIFEELGLSYEHTPSGIDDITVLLRQEQLTPETSAILLRRIKFELDVDHVEFKDPIALVMLVGEGMQEEVGTLARAANAFAKAGINIEMVNQGSSEVSIVFGISPEDEVAAVQALYDEFFGDVVAEDIGLNEYFEA